MNVGRSVPSPILGLDRQPFVRATFARVLPVDPERSDIEMLVFGQDVRWHLSEDALITIEGALGSTLSYVNAAATILLRAWNARRRNPVLLVQPTQEQWPHVTKPDARFPGYLPNSAGVSPTTMTVGERLPRRLRAAALTTELRHLWKTFT